ncbi:hypothetical protein SDC9_154691 [bioreactor metagenome]|uniref:Uncharacterized protein n=1 Tax=bioreactor metagenome TaxID=1076179 RepID=A0A645EZF6_9ZZZZ
MPQGVFGLRIEDRERRAQLVGGIGDEAAARLDHAFDAIHVQVDGIDQRHHFARQFGGLDRRQIVVRAVADGLAQPLHRLDRLPGSDQRDDQGNDHEQRLAADFTEEQTLHHLLPGIGRLAQDDQHRPGKLGAIQGFQHRPQAQGMAFVDAVVKHRDIGGQHLGRRQPLVAGDRFVTGMPDAVEHAIRAPGLEQLERRIGNVDHHLAVGGVDAFGDAFQRSRQRTVIGLVGGGQRIAIAEPGIDQQQGRQDADQPDRQAALEALGRQAAAHAGDQAPPSPVAAIR